MQSIIARLYCADCGIGFNNEQEIAIARVHAINVYSFVCWACNREEQGK